MPTFELPANQGSTRKMQRKVVAFFSPDWITKIYVSKLTSASAQTMGVQLSAYPLLMPDYREVWALNENGKKNFGSETCDEPSRKSRVHRFNEYKPFRNQWTKCFSFFGKIDFDGIVMDACPFVWFFVMVILVKHLFDLFVSLKSFCKFEYFEGKLVAVFLVSLNLIHRKQNIFSVSTGTSVFSSSFADFSLIFLTRFFFNFWVSIIFTAG